MSQSLHALLFHTQKYILFHSKKKYIILGRSTSMWIGTQHWSLTPYIKLGVLVTTLPSVYITTSPHHSNLPHHVSHAEEKQTDNKTEGGKRHTNGA